MPKTKKNVSKTQAKSSTNKSSKKLNQSNSVSSFFSQRRKILSFVLIFAVIGTATLAYSRAAKGVGVTHESLVPSRSVGATRVIETRASKRNANVIQITNPVGMNTARAVYTKVVPAGTYETCLTALPQTGAPAGSLTVKSSTGTTLGTRTFTTVAGRDYTSKIACVTIVHPGGATAAQNTLEFTVANATASTALRASIIVLEDRTTPPSGTGAIPARFVGGYLEWWSGLYPSQIDSRYTVVFHAFATIDSNGSLSLPLSVDRTRLANEYKARKAEGKPTILSIGGAGGAQAGLTTATQIQNFNASANRLVDEFGFSGIDWDLEEGVPGGISANGLVSASRQLKSRYGSNFAITMAPYANVETPYKEVARQLGTDLTFVGFQFYNMSTKVNAQIVNSKMEEWMRDTGIRESQFVVGLWYGPDDWQRFTVPETEMASIYSSVRATHPNVRGTYTWAIATTDRPRGAAFPAAMTPVVR